MISCDKNLALFQGYIQHAEEDDPERLKQIIERSVEDAEWIVKKYSKK